MSKNYPSIQPAQAPNTKLFVDINNNRTLLLYFQNLQQHFMVANNFGLALDDEDKPLGKQAPAYLRNLFVPPHISNRHFHPEQLIAEESQTQNWLTIAQVLKENPRLFLLGDPGSGKSTLLNWLMLALSHFGDNLTKMQIGGRVPFLLVLRDLPLSKVKDWESLWQVFMDKNQEQLTSQLCNDFELIRQLFNSGQALLLIDGLDEVTEPEYRRNLGQTVLEGINRFASCGFLISSRLLGFDQYEWFGLKPDQPLHSSEIIDQDNSKNFDTGLLKRPFKLKINIEINVIDNLPIYYLTPFDLAQTKQFISNWYRQYLGTDNGLPDRILELQKRTSQNDGLERLARVPVLLNMICFIHSRRGRLPDGRAELYQRIAETYLTSLDRARGLKFQGKEFNYDYLDLCEWLGKLALQLQDARNAEDQALLLDESEVKTLFYDELTNRGMSPEQAIEEIKFILNYIAQRSGLFIPRGKNAENQEQFGFSHLSFLEYFAASALKLEAQIDIDCLIERKGTISDAWWHECWALFFEQLENSRLAEKYLEELFKTPYDFPNDLRSMKQVALLSKIVMDSGVRLSIQFRHNKIKNIWSFYLITYTNTQLEPLEICGNLDRRFEYEYSVAFCELMWSQQFNSQDILLEIAKANNIETLILTGSTIKDLLPISSLKQLTQICLQDTLVNNLSPLNDFKQLTALYVVNTPISDLSPIAELKQLKKLSLTTTKCNNLSSLSGLHELNVLALNNSSISDLSPLKDLKQLRILILTMNKLIQDLSPLSALNELEEFYQYDNNINDITPLSVLKKLTHIGIPNKNLKGIDLFNKEDMAISFFD